MDFNNYVLKVLYALHAKFNIDFVVEDGKVRRVIYHD